MSDPTVLMTANLHGLAGRVPELRALLPSDVIVHRVSQNIHALDPNPPDPGMLG